MDFRHGAETSQVTRAADMLTVSCGISKPAEHATSATLAHRLAGLLHRDQKFNRHTHSLCRSARSVSHLHLPVLAPRLLNPAL